MRASTRGITLVEILVSLGIGMVLVAMGTSALLHVSKVFARNTAHLQGHEDAAGIHHRLAATMETMYHPARMGCRADPGPDLTWETGDETIELTWMNSLRSLDDGTMTYGPTPINDLLWQRLSWTGDGKGGGSLRFSDSGGKRQISGWTFNIGWNITPSLVIGPFVRRDRRRDLNDNDLRFLPGMDLATYTTVNAPGDGTVLNERLRPWHPASTQVATCVVEWIDAAGRSVRCDPAVGVTRRTASGAVIPSLGTPWSNATNQVIDGTWLDGRDFTPVGESSTASSQRPVQIRVTFDLILTTSGRIRFDREPRMSFSLTIPTAPVLPLL